MPDRLSHPETSGERRSSWPIRIGIIAGFALLIAVVYAMGWHRQLSLETLISHRALIDAFVREHYLAALAVFIGLYVATVSLSIPAALVLTVSSGILFGPIVGPIASIVGSTTGATLVFLVAQTALGEQLVRRAGPLATKLADGFRADAFSYLLFLRLAPVFPFWLVNLAPALFGVRLRTFVAATVIGVTPGAFAFAFAGSSLDSVIAAQEQVFRECLAGGREGCRHFNVHDLMTWRLLVALGAIGVIALIPVAVKRLRFYRHAK